MHLATKTHNIEHANHVDTRRQTESRNGILARAHSLVNASSKLTCVPTLGRAPMLVYVRPSNEALLRARVPGAQDQHGCPLPVLFTVRVLRARRTPGCCPPHPLEAARCTSIEDHQALSRPAFRECGTNGDILLLMRDLESKFMELPPLLPQTLIVILSFHLRVSACHPHPGG